MGNHLKHVCCTDKGILVTYENISSRISSPTNHEFQRVVLDFPDSTNPIEQLEVCPTPNEKPKMIRRTLSGLGEIRRSNGYVRTIKRSLTIKTNETFLKKAKRRISMLRLNSDETPKIKEINSGTKKGKILEFEWHLGIPNGDRDVDAE